MWAVQIRGLVELSETVTNDTRSSDRLTGEENAGDRHSTYRLHCGNCSDLFRTDSCQELSQEDDL